MHQLITRDPVSGGELIVTRLECPDSGIVIEGQFSLGWIGRLSREQLVRQRTMGGQIAAPFSTVLLLRRSASKKPCV